MTGHVGTIVLTWALLSVLVAYLLGAFLTAAKRGPSTRISGPFCDDCPDHEACMTGYPCDFVKAACGRQS
jgi:hypothetical protein